MSSRMGKKRKDDDDTWEGEGISDSSKKTVSKSGDKYKEFKKSKTGRKIQSSINKLKFTLLGIVFSILGIFGIPNPYGNKVKGSVCSVYQLTYEAFFAMAGIFLGFWFLALLWGMLMRVNPLQSWADDMEYLLWKKGQIMSSLLYTYFIVINDPVLLDSKKEEHIQAMGELLKARKEEKEKAEAEAALAAAEAEAVEAGAAEGGGKKSNNLTGFLNKGKQILKYMMKGGEAGEEKPENETNTLLKSLIEKQQEQHLQFIEKQEMDIAIKQEEVMKEQMIEEKNEALNLLRYPYFHPTNKMFPLPLPEFIISTSKNSYLGFVWSLIAFFANYGLLLSFFFLILGIIYFLIHLTYPCVNWGSGMKKEDEEDSGGGGSGGGEGGGGGKGGDNSA